MAIKTHLSYVLSNESEPSFNRDYSNYVAYRNALVKINENAELLVKENSGTVTADDLKPKFDTVDSIAIGYGFDPLARDNGEIES